MTSIFRLTLTAALLGALAVPAMAQGGAGTRAPGQPPAAPAVTRTATPAVTPAATPATTPATQAGAAVTPGKPAMAPTGATTGAPTGPTAGRVMLGPQNCIVNGWANHQISILAPAGAAIDSLTVKNAAGSDVSVDSFEVIEYTAPTAAGPVTEFSATPGNGQVVLSWRGPYDIGGAVVSDYVVRFRLAATQPGQLNFWQTYEHRPFIGNSFTVGGLANNEAYDFQIFAVNRVGTGAGSSLASATPAGTATVFRASSQTYTTSAADLQAACGAGTTATPVTATSSDGVSTLSQSEANSIALARAMSLAKSGIVCPFVPGTLAIADGSITDAKLATDNKVGSLTAAAQAFPQAARSVLTSVQAFLVYLVGAFNGLAGRVDLLEARPTGGTGGGGTGTVKSVNTLLPDINGNVTIPSGGATYPTQNAATTGQYLRSNGTAGGEAWAGMKRGRVLRFLNAEITDPERFFRATAVYRIEKDGGIAGLTYAVNGAAAVAVVFTANVWAGTLQIPANGLVVWAITYESGQNSGNVEILATELTTP